MADDSPTKKIDRINRYQRVRSQMEKGGGDTPYKPRKESHSAPEPQQGAMTRPTSPRYSMKVGGTQKTRVMLERTLRETE